MMRLGSQVVLLYKWRLQEQETRLYHLREYYNQQQMQGLHLSIHCSPLPDQGNKEVQ